MSTAQDLSLLPDPEPIRVVVYGTPAPAGSKRGFPIRGKGGQIRIAMTDDSKRGKPWHAQVRAEGAAAMDGRALLRGPLEVDMTFVVRRPKGHHGKRGLRPSAPRHPTTRPDVLKLARNVEDSLTGVVWADDAQIVRELLVKEYGEPERCEIEITKPRRRPLVLAATCPLWAALRAAAERRRK